MVAKIGDDVRVDHGIGFDPEGRHDVGLVRRQHPGQETALLVAVRQDRGHVPSEQDPGVGVDDERTQRRAVEVLGQMAVVPPQSGGFDGVRQVGPGGGADGTRPRLRATFEGQRAIGRNEGRPFEVPWNVRIGDVEPDAVPGPVFADRGFQEIETPADARSSRFSDGLGSRARVGSSPAGAPGGASAARGHEASS